MSRRNATVKIWIRLIAAAVVLGGAVYLTANVFGAADGASQDGSAPAVALAALRPPEVSMQLLPGEVLQVTRASLVERLTVGGEIAPVQRVILRARSGGVVMEVTVREGEAVRAGALLVRFGTEDLAATLAQGQSQIDATKTQLHFAQQVLDRSVVLAERMVTAQVELDQARREVSVLTAQLAGLEAQAEITRAELRDSEIRAPFDGVVASRSVDVGERVSAEAELLILVDPAMMEARVLVATRDAPRIAPGQATELRIDGLGDATIKGRVQRINPVADDGTRFISVYIALPNPDGRLRGGMFATGTILVAQSDNVLALPASALRQDAGGTFVIKLENGMLARQPVAAGPSWSDGQVEILDGIASGDTIVIAPLSGLRAGMPAEVSGS